MNYAATCITTFNPANTRDTFACFEVALIIDARL